MDIAVEKRDGQYVEAIYEKSALPTSTSSKHKTHTTDDSAMAWETSPVHLARHKAWRNPEIQRIEFQN